MTDHGWGINLSAHSPTRARAAAAQPGAPRAQPPPWGPPAETLLSSGGAVSAQTPQKRAGGFGGTEHLGSGLWMASDAEGPARLLTPVPACHSALSLQPTEGHMQ